MSGAAIMMFGKDPQRFFPRSRVRFIRYEGTEAKVGAEMNVIKDKMFQGRILDLVEQTIEYVREFGEGVDRMYREMEEAGLPEPEYKTVAFMVHATIKNKKYLVESEAY